MIRRLPIVISLLLLLLGGLWLYQRYIRFNAGVVVPGSVYRSAQPSPAYLEKIARQHNLKTVVAMMRSEQPWFRSAEEDKLAQLGINYLYLSTTNARRPSRSEMLRLIEMVETVPRPVLIHCKTGADRTGAASALFAMHDLHQPVDQAVGQNVTLTHLHTGKPGDEINDIFDLYLNARAKNNQPPGGWTEFVHWIKNDYPADIADARLVPATEHLTIPQGQTFTLEVTVTNNSPLAWPDEPNHPIVLVAHRESADGQSRQTFGQIPVRPKLASGESQVLSLPITIPADHRLGSTRLRLDILQTDIAYFSHDGQRIVNLTIDVVPPPIESAKNDARS